MAEWLMPVDSFIYEHLEVNKYINYCEAVVTKSGLIGYAIPSHQYALMRFYGNYSAEDIMNHEIAEKIWNKIPVSAGALQWMCEDLQVASIWYNGIVLPKDYTTEQLETIVTLMKKSIINKNCSMDVSIEKSLCKLLENPDQEDFKNKLDTLHEYKRNQLNTACLRLYTLLKEE